MSRLLRHSMLAVACLLGGCAASPEKQMARMEAAGVKENSRLTEERRMRAISYGDVASKRGAEVLVYEPDKKFDAGRSGINTSRTVGAEGARTKGFQYEQKTRTGNFLTRAFGAKSNHSGERAYATRDARTQGDYEIPNKDEQVGQKAATTKELRDGDKIAATRDLQDGQRPFLGPESKKLNTAIDSKTMADWRSAGTESVGYSGTSVEKMSTLKQLSMEDIRELLNKNK